jgi:hypothetical protein
MKPAEAGSKLVLLFDPEDGGDVFRWNIGLSKLHGVTMQKTVLFSFSYDREAVTDQDRKPSITNMYSWKKGTMFVSLDLVYVLYFLIFSIVNIVELLTLHKLCIQVWLVFRRCLVRISYRKPTIVTGSDRVYLEKLMVTQQFVKFLAFLEPHGSLPCSQKPTRSIHHMFLKMCLNVILPFMSSCVM